MAEGGEGEPAADTWPAADAVTLVEAEPVRDKVENPPAMIEAGEPVEVADEELPAVEELVKRLRPEVLAALDELFRAKWTSVKRLRPEDLKTG